MSPPLVVGDVVIVGSSISDGPRYKLAPPGDVRAFDVRTGEERWQFHTVPQRGEFGNDTWGDESWTYTGNTNVWTIMSADLDLGYVYLPIGTPTNDWGLGIGWVTTCLPRAWWPSRLPPVHACGTTNWSITVSGTTTSRRHPRLSISPSAADRSGRLPRSPSKALSTSLTA